jgi:hypothetical protein
MTPFADIEEIDDEVPDLEDANDDHPSSRTDFQSYMRPLAVALQLSCMTIASMISLMLTGRDSRALLVT